MKIEMRECDIEKLDFFTKTVYVLEAESGNHVPVDVIFPKDLMSCVKIIPMEPKPIDEYRLSVRAFNVLRNMGIKTTDQLDRLTEQNLKDYRTCGVKTAREIMLYKSKIEKGD